MPVNIRLMKGFFTLVFFVIVAISGSYAQKLSKTSGSRGTSAKPAGEVIGLKDTSYNFGKIPQGRPVIHNFDLINKGKTPLLLNSVEASCGCTTPQWSEAPIAPGAASVIKVGFNAASEGHFSKTITITYNGNQVKTLVISGDVYATPTTSAPLNTSLSFIKQINQ